MTVIKCEGMGSPFVEGPRGQFLVAYDNKTGESDWSYDKSQALRFAGKFEAFQFCMQILESDPIRPDGKPNRPLTAFTVLIEEE
jgi:hypothetical protein